MSRHVNFKLMSLYLDERLSQEHKRLIGAHLSTCQNCKEELLSLKTTTNTLKSLPETKESEGFDFEFRQKLNEALAKSDQKQVYGGFRSILEGLRPIILRPVPVLVKATALITVMAFLITSILWNQSAVTPAIASVQGEAEVYNSKTKQWGNAQKGTLLKKGDIIRVAKNSQITVESKRYALLLKEDTEVRAVGIEKPFGQSKGISYELDRGKILVATKKGFKDSKLKIGSPLAEVSVKGTGFLVDVSPLRENKTWVGVLNGQVEVSSKIQLAGLSSKVLVGAGKATEIFSDSTPTTPRYLAEDEWKAVQEIYRIGEQPQVALLISMTPRRVHELLRPVGLYISDDKTKALPKELIKIIAQIDEAIVAESKQKHLDAIYSLENLIAKYPDSKYNIQFLFFIAKYYYYVNEYHKAISVFDHIIKEYPNSNLVSLALCAKGLIYEKGIKDPTNALLVYKAVLANYPNSLEVKEAAAGLMRLRPEQLP